MNEGWEARTRGYVQRTIACVMAVLVGVLAVAAPSSADLGNLPYRLQPGMTSSVGADLRSLATSESLIVWEDHRDGRPDLYAYDLDDAREFRPLTSAAHRRQPDVAGSKILWVEGEDAQESMIRGIDLADGDEFALTDQPSRVSSPSISGSLAAWQQRDDGQWVIQVRRIGADETATLGDDSVNNGRPDVSGARVVWQSFDGDSWNIRLFDVRSGEVTRVSDRPENDQYPVIDGEHVIFTRTAQEGGTPQLILVDVENGDEQVLADGHYLQRPSINGDLVVWEDWRSGLPDIYAYDLEHDESFAVARSQQASTPVISDRIIAWVSGADRGHQRVQTLEIQERLPTDPEDPPAVPTPDRLYVPETQHYVSAGFKSFWQANGGPSVFGYPLTEEFTEVDEETGEELTVQYFERVKLEFHPDAPDDSKIQLARLGDDLRPEMDIQRAEPYEENAHRQYFEETGQGVRDEFKEYWESNGGLAVFGYPITGEFMENGRKVQYFERARFEVDPEADDGQIRLGLLGREALQERGWIPPPPVDTTRIFE